MGLLGRIGRGAGRFATAGGDELGASWQANAPLGNAAMMGVPGAALGAGGAMAQGQDPLQGAMMGGALGAGLGGVQAGRALMGGLRAGMGGAMQSPQKIAMEIAQRHPPAQWDQALMSVASTLGDDTAREVARILGRV